MNTPLRPRFLYLGGQQQDLISNTLLDVESATIAQGISAAGPSLNIGTTASHYLVWPGTIKYLQPEFSLVAVVVPNAVTGNHVLLHTGTVNNNIQSGVAIWGDNSGFETGNANCWSISTGQDKRHETAPNTYVAGTPNVLVVNWRQTGTIESWANGNYKSGYDKGFSGALTDSSSAYTRIGGSGQLNAFNGRIVMLAVFDTAFDSSSGIGEILSDNPFSIFNTNDQITPVLQGQVGQPPALLLQGFAA